MRPDADKILNLPFVLSKIDKVVPFEVENSELLNTIKMPKNLHLLSDHLPKPT